MQINSGSFGSISPGSEGLSGGQIRAGGVDREEREPGVTAFSLAGKSRGGGRGMYAEVDGDVPLGFRRKEGSKSNTEVAAGRADAPHQDGSANAYADACTNFIAITWNACGMEAGAVNDLVDILAQDRIQWDAILLQEGPASEAAGGTILEGGHVLFRSAKGNSWTVGILLHRRWSEVRVSFKALTDRVVFLDVGFGAVQMRLISAHLPHSGLAEDLYDATLACVEEAIEGSRRNGSMTLVGIDANAVVGRREATDNHDIIGEFGWGSRNSRGRHFVVRLHGQRIAVTAIMICHGCNNVLEP